MVGRRYQRKTCASQGPGWRCKEVANRVCGGGRRPSFNDQQSVHASELAPHYDQHPLGALLAGGTASQGFSTQDTYIIYAKNWILPRWGNLPLEGIQTVEVERWLRSTDVADGTKAKIKCVMSALFSHAVQWEFCGNNPISSWILVGTG